MNSAAIRLYVVVGIIVTTFGLTWLSGIATESPDVETPDWSLTDMPLQLDKWHGQPAKLDAEIAAASGAQVIVDRSYQNELGRTVTVHTAFFDDPKVGLSHIPTNCYRAHGWKNRRNAKEDIEVTDNLSVPVRLEVWEKEGEKYLVGYWYQLGNHFLYGRDDLGAVRWALRGQAKWPVLMKIMIQTPITENGDSEEVLLDFGKQLAKWFNSPEHRKYFEHWHGV